MERGDIPYPFQQLHRATSDVTPASKSPDPHQTQMQKPHCLVHNLPKNATRKAADEQGAMYTVM